MNSRAISAGNPVSRRAFTVSAGAFLAAPAIIRRAGARNGRTHILMKSDALGARVWFDPIGLLVEPGTTVEWTLEANVHTATAYHPGNAGHSLRIPEAAAPWDSGYLVEPGSSFSVTLTEPGVYDYFCAPHEFAGMVGRLVVGAPGGPGAEPFDYFERLQPPPDWLAVPDAARAAFPGIAEIMAEGRVAVG